MDHHRLDVWPEPRDSEPRFINEPWLADQELYDYGPRKREPEQQEDNIRTYVPVDLNPWIFIAIAAGTIVACTVALLLPAAYISRVEPAKTIRFE
jgi:ABC-type lipoprotein release transport system permease subunit